AGRINRRRFLQALGAIASTTMSSEMSAALAKNVRRSGLVYSPRYLEHLTGEGHPERPARLRAVMDALRTAGLQEQLVKIEPRPASMDDVVRCHTRDYFRIAKRDIESG